jgi:hypothetical protein
MKQKFPVINFKNPVKPKKGVVARAIIKKSKEMNFDQKGVTTIKNQFMNRFFLQTRRNNLMSPYHAKF